MLWLALGLWLGLEMYYGQDKYRVMISVGIKA